MECNGCNVALARVPERRPNGRAPDNPHDDVPMWIRPDGERQMKPRTVHTASKKARSPSVVAQNEADASVEEKSRVARVNERKIAVSDLGEATEAAKSLASTLDKLAARGSLLAQRLAQLDSVIHHGEPEDERGEMDFLARDVATLSALASWNAETVVFELERALERLQNTEAAGAQ